jgi:hypothetical protein
MGSTHIAGEIDTFFLAGLGVVQVNLDIGRTQATGTLQANSRVQGLRINQAKPTP